MTSLCIGLFIIVPISLWIMVLFSRKKQKNKFVTYDEAIKKIINEAPDSDIVRHSMCYDEEREFSYWRYIINRHFFPSYNTNNDQGYKPVKIKTFNESTFGQISVKNLNEFIRSIKEEVKKQEKDGIKFYYGNRVPLITEKDEKFYGGLDA